MNRLEVGAVIAADAVGLLSSEVLLSKADDIFFKLSAKLAHIDMI
jgi:hypothetical protein